MKIRAIAVPATLATVYPASAGQRLIFEILNIFDVQCPRPLVTGMGTEGVAATFLKGTNIRTTEGERKIEDLAACDLLPTKLGGLRAVQSIGRYPYRKSDPSKPWAELADSHRPLVRISALAPNVPHADLYVIAARSLLIDDVLVPAELLINGTTITRFEARGRLR